MSVFEADDVFIRVRRKRGRRESAVDALTDNDPTIIVGTKKAKIEQQMAALTVGTQQQQQACDALKVFKRVATLDDSLAHPLFEDSKCSNAEPSALDDVLAGALSRIKAAEDRKRRFKQPSIDAGVAKDTARENLLRAKRRRFYTAIAQKRDELKGINVIDLVEVDESKDGDEQDAPEHFNDDYVWDIYIHDHSQPEAEELGEEFMPQVVLYEYSHDFFFGVDQEYSDSDSNREDHPYNSYPEESDHAGSEEDEHDADGFVRHLRHRTDGDSDFDPYDHDGEDYGNEDQGFY